MMSAFKVLLAIYTFAALVLLFVSIVIAVWPSFPLWKKRGGTEFRQEAVNRAPTHS